MSYEYEYGYSTYGGFERVGVDHRSYAEWWVSYGPDREEAMRVYSYIPETNEMRREYHYDKFTGNMGAILEIEEAIGKAFYDHFEIDSIRIHPEGSLELNKVTLAGMNSFLYFTHFTSEVCVGGYMVNQYRNKWTGKSLSIILDEGYPKNWFALECEQPSSGTEVPELLVGNSYRKIKLGS